MKLPQFALSVKTLIGIALLLIGIPVTVYLVSIQQNTSQQASDYPACAPEKPPSGWPECRYGQDTYNMQACRQRAEEWKGVSGPGNDAPEVDWFKWAQDPPRQLSCGTACGLAPSFCKVENTPTPLPTNTPVPSATSVPPSNTPKPSNTPNPTSTPSPSNTPIPTNTPQPTATNIQASPTNPISSCPVPVVSEGGMNIRIDCPFCENELR